MLGSKPGAIASAVVSGLRRAGRSLALPRLVPLLVLAATVSGCSPGPAQEAPAEETPVDDPSDPENRLFQVLADEDTPSARQGAREQVGTQIVEAILVDLSYSVLSPDSRKALREVLPQILRDERFLASADGRGFRYSARASLNEATDRVLDALRASEVVGEEEFILLIEPGDWFNADGLDDHERALLPLVVSAGCSESLIRYRMRKAPASSDKERVRRGAIELGASPSTEALQSFADLFRVGWVVTISGAIRFEPTPAGADGSGDSYGYLRCEGLRARVYNRKLDNVIVEFVLSSDPGRHEPSPPGKPRRLHQPPVPKNVSLSEQVEAYARLIGKIVGENLVRRLFQRFYATR